jgi:hypothetical protein
MKKELLCDFALLFCLIASLSIPTSIHASYITHIQVKDVGDSQLITLDAKLYGDPFHPYGDKTPFRYLIDVAPGDYKVTFVDSVPGYVAWSPYNSSYRLPGLWLEHYQNGGLGTWAVAWPTTVYTSTQQTAFDALVVKEFNFTVNSEMTLLARLGDHILWDNIGGVSFVIEKMTSNVVPEPGTCLVGMSALVMLGAFTWRNRK